MVSVKGVLQVKDQKTFEDEPACDMSSRLTLFLGLGARGLRTRLLLVFVDEELLSGLDFLLVDMLSKMLVRRG